MKLFIILMMFSMMTGLTAQKQVKQLPPLIDREIFFGDPEISGGQLSPDGKFMSFIKPFNGTRNIWVKKTDAAFETAKPLTADEKRPITSYFWSRNGKYILYVQDKGGNENFQVYAVSPTEKPEEGKDVPVSRNLTNKENTRVYIYAVPKTLPDVIFIGLNDRDASWHDLYELKISTGELKLLRKNTDRITGWVFDRRDKLKIAERTNDDGSTDLLRVDPKGFVKIYSVGPLESANAVNFHEDGQRIYLVTNKGEKNNLSKLVLFNITSQKEEPIESDPKKRVDFGSVSFSDIDNRMIATYYDDEKTRIYWKDKSFETDYKALKKAFNGLEVAFTSSTKDEKMWLIAVYSDTDNGSVYSFDRISKKTKFQYRPRPKLTNTDLASMKPITYKSSDGLEIPAYLTLPKGITAKNLPLIVNPHGGPWAKDSWGFNPYVQFLANRGYAVLQMNFRGSTGYGKKFIDAGNRQWGDKMQDDITWGVKYLISKGIADPKRIGIMGGSYGGYATLAGVTYTPDLYSAAISIVGPSSLLTLLASIPPYWEAGRKIFHLRMGDPTTPEGEAQLRRQSPLFHVDQIKTPLMIVQGANDPRVKKAESDQIVYAMNQSKLDVEYICAPDEGHGFARPINNMAFLAAAEKFFADHLGGRYQESMSPEISKRLKEITVNPASVTLPKKIEIKEAEVKQDSGMATITLKPGKYIYNVSLDMMGEAMEFEQITTIEDSGSIWKISDEMKMPMGEIVDKLSLNKENLNPITRKIDQGPIYIELNYEEKLVNGRMNMNGKKSPLNITTTGACKTDGPGGFFVIASLPLTENYTTLLRNIDLQMLTEKIYALEVVATESVKNQACYKVKLIPANGDPGEIIIWISKGEHPTPLKYEMTLPEFNGSTMKAELK
ncbi:MAG: prolyl oligopeptidase family serine peptidase [Saprospiraceae bacterium]